MNRNRVFGLMFVTIGLLAGLLLSRSAQASFGLPGWHWESVTAGSYLSLAVDDAGQGHVAFYDSVTRNLKYAVREAGGWQVTTADDGYYTGIDPSLGLDAAGYAHISHVSGTIHRLYYTYRDAVGWHSETVADGIPFAEAPLVVDEEDRVHLAFPIRDADVNQVTHAVRVDGSWQSEALFSCPSGTNEGCSNVDMALDAAGHLHIAFAVRRSGGVSVMHASNESGGWLVEEAVGTPVTWGVHELSLAVDGRGQPHISQSDYQNLRYTFRDGDGWHSEIVVDGGAALWNDMAVSDEGGPHVAYYDRQRGALRYATRYDDGWRIVALDDSGWVGHFPSIVLVEGYPAVAYLDPSDSGPQMIRYAYLTPLDILPGTYPNLIDPTGDEKIMVIVIGTAYLDVEVIDPLRARFGPAGTPIVNGRYRYKDADLDGDVDLALFFRTGDAGIPCGAPTAVVHAETYDGGSFSGWDDITTIGCEE